MSTYINYIDYYIPETVINLKKTEKKKLDAFENENLEFHINTLGVENIPIMTNTDIHDNLFNLLDRLFENTDLLPSEIDYIIVANDFEDQLVNIGHSVQHEYGMDNNTQIIKIGGNYCANIDIALGFFNKISQISGSIKALVITGLCLQDQLSKRIVGNYGVLGDSLGIVILSNNSENALYKFCHQMTITDGKLAIIDMAKDNTLVHYKNYCELLEKFSIDMALDNIQKIILHNANSLLVEQVLKSYNVETNKIDKTNIKKFGHLGTTDLLFNLSTIHNVNKNIKNEINIISISLGILGTYVCTQFKFLKIKK